MSQPTENKPPLKRTSTLRAIAFGLTIGLIAALGVQFSGTSYWIGVLAGLAAGITFMFGPGQRIR